MNPDNFSAEYSCAWKTNKQKIWTSRVHSYVGNLYEFASLLQTLDLPV